MNYDFFRFCFRKFSVWRGVVVLLVLVSIPADLTAASFTFYYTLQCPRIESGPFIQIEITPYHSDQQTFNLSSRPAGTNVYLTYASIRASNRVYRIKDCASGQTLYEMQATAAVVNSTNEYHLYLGPWLGTCATNSNCPQNISVRNTGADAKRVIFTSNSVPVYWRSVSPGASASYSVQAPCNSGFVLAAYWASPEVTLPGDVPGTDFPELEPGDPYIGVTNAGDYAGPTVTNTLPGNGYGAKEPGTSWTNYYYSSNSAINWGTAALPAGAALDATLRVGFNATLEALQGLGNKLASYLQRITNGSQAMVSNNILVSVTNWSPTIISNLNVGVSNDWEGMIFAESNHVESAAAGVVSYFSNLFRDITAVEPVQAVKNKIEEDFAWYIPPTVGQGGGGGEFELVIANATLGKPIKIKSEMLGNRWVRTLLAWVAVALTYYLMMDSGFKSLTSALNNPQGTTPVSLVSVGSTGGGMGLAMALLVCGAIAGVPVVWQAWLASAQLGPSAVSWASVSSIIPVDVFQIADRFVPIDTYVWALSIYMAWRVFLATTFTALAFVIRCLVGA